MEKKASKSFTLGYVFIYILLGEAGDITKDRQPDHVMQCHQHNFLYYKKAYASIGP
jgi:hypothetical protein